MWLAVAFKIAATALFIGMTWRILRGPIPSNIDDEHDGSNQGDSIT